MGRYLNPGKDEFESICSSEYVDKTGLIHEINQVINTANKLTLVSRPRRFGKSYAATMLCAYYGYGNNSRNLFLDKEIYRIDPALSNHGEYHVIYLDMSEIKGRILDWQRYLDEEASAKCEAPVKVKWISFLQQIITEDIREACGDEVVSYSFAETLENLVNYEEERRKIFWICDEWDLFIREECQDSDIVSDYLEFLRKLFKSSSGFTSRVFAGAYLTGIMPMKVMKGESAVSGFMNYTMLNPGRLAPYIGFTVRESQYLCSKYGVDYDELAEWYDGYYFDSVGSVFNPCSVMQTIHFRQFTSYWVQTSGYEQLKTCIELDFDGLWEIVLSLVSGTEAIIDLTGRKFGNDLNQLTNKTDVLTALVHLGYLAYNPLTRRLKVPNKEIQKEFIDTLAESKHTETARMIREADSLLEATWKKDESEVAKLLEMTHNLTGDPKSYNNEARLALTVKLAYYTARDYYVEISELPGGKGYIDLLFLPRKNTDKPMLVIELKWDKPVNAAIKQIKNRQYPLTLQNYGGRVLLVGITYKTKGKKHSCVIEDLEI